MTPLSLMLVGSVAAAPGKVMVRKLPEAAAATVACAAAALAAEPRARTGASVMRHHKSARFTRTSVVDDDKGPSGQPSRPYAAESARVNEAQLPTRALRADAANTAVQAACSGRPFPWQNRQETAGTRGQRLPTPLGF